MMEPTRQGGLWQSFRTWVQPNLGKKEKWMPFHTAGSLDGTEGHRRSWKVLEEVVVALRSWRSPGSAKENGAF